MTIRAVLPEIAALPKVAHLCNFSLKDTFVFGKHTFRFHPPVVALAVKKE